jgi:hypothetical protein
MPVARTTAGGKGGRQLTPNEASAPDEQLARTEIDGDDERKKSMEDEDGGWYSLISQHD